MRNTNESRVLPAEKIEQWERDGYLVVPRLFQEEEMRAVSEEVWALTCRQDLIDQRNLRCRFQQTHDGSTPLWETFDPVIDLSPACKNLALDPRLLEALHDLYGEPACLFKDKLIFKQPGTRGYGLHQDWISWPGFPRSFLTVLIPIDPATERNGCTEVFPGYHREGPLSPEDGEYHQLSSDQIPESTGKKLVLEPGDVAIFAGFTPHRSGPNLSDSWRRQLYLSYNALSDGGRQRESHYEQFHEYLRKRQAGPDSNDLYFR